MGSESVLAYTRVYPYIEHFGVRLNLELMSCARAVFVGVYLPYLKVLFYHLNDSLSIC